MGESNNIIREEFLLLAERLKLDTRFWSQESGVESLESVVKGLEFELKTFLTQDSGQICVGHYMPNWEYDNISTKRLSDRTLEALVGVYKKLFLPHRQIRFIGVDLDDCFYDVTPIRHLLVQKINNVLSGELRVRAHDPRLETHNSQLSWALYNTYKNDLEAEDVKKQKASAALASSGFSYNIKETMERTYHAYKDFSRLDALDTRALYKPYEGVVDTLKHLIDSGDFIIGILTNGPSRLQRDKINLLGLKEGEHFNFVQVSDDIGIGKPSKKFFEHARERASQYTKNMIEDIECLILEDQVKNISGAEDWLKIQFLKGYHLNIQPENIQEIPKYGITSFSILPYLLNLEKDSGFQAMAASYFILKVLLLLHR